MSVPKILITGCAGYIGSVLTGQLLGAGARVIGVDALIYQNEAAILPHLGNPLFEFHKRDAEAVLPLARRADVVIPLAALVGAPLCEKQIGEARRVNYKAIKDLTASLSPNQRIVYPNTNSGYGSTTGSNACVETDPLNPVNQAGLRRPALLGPSFSWLPTPGCMGFTIWVCPTQI